MSDLETGDDTTTNPMSKDDKDNEEVFVRPGLTRESSVQLEMLHLDVKKYQEQKKTGASNLVGLLLKYRKGKMGSSRSAEIQQKFSDLENQNDWKKHLVEFWVAFDPCFITDIDIEAAWMAIKRREAWRRKPWTMALVHFTQFALAIFASVSNNTAVNASTAVMAVLYIFILLIQKDFVVTKELFDDYLIKQIYEKQLKPKYSPVLLNLLIVLSAPILFCLFLGSIIFEFLTGKIMEVSWGSLVDLLISVFVVCTSISVGLRSGNGISAIQTFVGFDFISSFDELVIETIEPDFFAPAPPYADEDNPDQKKLRKERLCPERIRFAGLFILPYR